MDAPTILDLLDRLEAEVVSLRSRNHELERAANGTSTHRKKSAPRKTSKGKSARKPKRASKKAAPTPPAAKPAQMALSDFTNADEARRPITGKRQALGRSIIQLRRLNAHSPES